MRGTLRHLGLAFALAFLTMGVAQADPGDDPLFRPGLNLKFEFGGSAGQVRQAYLNGMPLRAAQPGPLKARQDSDGGSNAAAIVLAVGIGIALIVLVAGNAADDLSENYDGKNGEGDGGLGGNCRDQVPETPATSGCGVGTGG
jgi:hypothetical protein